MCNKGDLCQEWSPKVREVISSGPYVFSFLNRQRGLLKIRVVLRQNDKGLTLTSHLDFLREILRSS